MNTRIKKLLAVLVAVILFVPILVHSVSAEGENKVDVKATNVRFQTMSGNDTDFAVENSRFKLAIDWDASSYNDTLKAGDYFEVKIPSGFHTHGHQVENFTLTSPEGDIVANAHLTQTGAGSVIKVTFTDYVENRFNVHGDLYVTGQFWGSGTNVGEENIYDITVGNTTTQVPIFIGEAQERPDEIYVKFPNISRDPEIANWILRINVAKENIQNVVISDKIGDTTYENATKGEIYYIPGSFVLKEVVYNTKGEVVETLSTKNISDLIELNEDNTAFTFNLSEHFGDLEGQQYRLEYQTNNIPGVKIYNASNLKGTGKYEISNSSYDSEAGGTGVGDLFSKILIRKVDADDNKVKLPGATFKIKNTTTGETVEVTTDENGEALTEKLIGGVHEITEVKAPEGYLLNKEIVEVTVYENRANIVTITNTKGTDETEAETEDESKDETEDESKDETKDESKDETKDESNDESKTESETETDEDPKTTTTTTTTQNPKTGDAGVGLAVLTFVATGGASLFLSKKKK